MITIRKASERGHTQIGWLDSYHTFSFGDYEDQAHHGFRALRVINQDKVEPGQGFGTHGHRDMEIISYVLDGEVEHKDSMGTGSIIRPGDVQRMSAGSGVTHSERNPSLITPVRFLQIWIFPDKKGLKPSYAQKKFTDEQKEGRLLLVASSDSKEGSISIHQDANLYASILKKGQATAYVNRKDRYAWVQVARGTLKMNDKELKEGDGAAISGAESLRFETSDKTEFLLFDLA